MAILSSTIVNGSLNVTGVLLVGGQKVATIDNTNS